MPLCLPSGARAAGKSRAPAFFRKLRGRYVDLGIKEEIDIRRITYSKERTHHFTTHSTEGKMTASYIILSAGLSLFWFVGGRNVIEHSDSFRNVVCTAAVGGNLGSCSG